jgi:hypothetical protein
MNVWRNSRWGASQSISGNLLEGLLIELLIRTLCDTVLDIQADSAYLFAQTVDNQESVFDAGVDLVNQQRAKQLLIPDSIPQGGYPGFQAWHQELMGYGVRETKIIGVSTASFSTLNTLVEAKALVRYAQENNITRVFIVASPFQQLRAFITTVSVLLRVFPELRVYNRVGTALPWDETVVHSQGTLQGKRSELIQGELDRIDRYRRKGDLVSEDEVFRYLRWRDSKIYG